METPARRDSDRQAAPARNYLRRHLAGEFSLWRSIGLHTLVPCLAVPLVGAVVLPYLGDHFPARYLSGALILLLTLGYLVVAWAVTGTARSAARHVDRGGRRWTALTAGVLLLLGLAKLALDTGGAIPLLREHWKVATGAQPGPRPEITLRPDGRSILFAGSFNDGSADALAKALSYFPHVQTVVLKSHGGWIREGEMMAGVISRHQLDTTVETYCESACTVALVAGRNRHAAPGAKVGFHSGRAIGVADPTEESPGITLRLLTAYRAAGLSPGFINKVARVPHDEVWYPTHEELLAVGVLSAVDWAPGGLPATRAVKSPEELAQLYRAHDSLAVLASRFPRDFEQIVENTWHLLRAGATDQVVQATIRTHLHRLLPSYAAMASDEMLSLYLDLLRDQLEALRPLDPQACVELVYPTGRGAAPARYLPAELMKRERELLVRALREAESERLSALAEHEATARALETATAGLGVLEIAAVMHPAVRVDQPALACGALMKLTSRLSEMPADSRALVLRLLLARSVPR